jgi:diguanylate cyclase (GGDEF)-like protein
MFVDLDGFKAVNDTYGHDAGDDLLRAVAGRLRAVLRPGDMVARLAGDEFAVLCEDIDGEPEAVGLARRILRTVAEPVDLGGRSVVATPSVGVALSGPAADRPDVLLRDADLAMYAAKRRGTGRYAVFDQAMRARTARRAELEDDLRRAVEEEQFELVYAPVTDLDGLLVGVDVRMRWEHPTRGSVRPAEFIPLAEQTDLVYPLASWVLRKACAAAAGYAGPTSGGRPLRVAVRLPARLITDPALEDLVRGAVRRADEVGSSQLCVTISGDLLTTRARGPALVLQRLRNLGVLIAVDDFGAGAYPLTQLRTLPVDQVRIARSLVAGLGRDPTDEAVVTSLITFARALRHEALGVGADTAEQVDFLRTVGCDLVSGRHLAPAEIDLAAPPAG